MTDNFTVNANVFCEGVYEVSGKTLGLKTDKTYNVFYPLNKFTSSACIDSIKKASISEQHIHINNSNRKEYECGRVVGEPKIIDGNIQCEILITDDVSIQKINKEKSLHDCSLSIDCTVINQAGRYENNDYDCYIKDVTVNHIAILPKNEGRMGTNVSIMNGKDIYEMENNKQETALTPTEREQLINRIAALEVENNRIVQINNEAEDKLEKAKHAIKETFARDIAIAKLIDNKIGTKISTSELTGRALYDYTLKTIGIDSSHFTDAESEMAFKHIPDMSEAIKKMIESVNIEPEHEKAKEQDENIKIDNSIEKRRTLSDIINSRIEKSNA